MSRLFLEIVTMENGEVDPTVPRAPEKEDPNVHRFLRRADSAGPVSPTCFDV